MTELSRAAQLGALLKDRGDTVAVAESDGAASSAKSPSSAGGGTFSSVRMVSRDIRSAKCSKV